MSSGPGMPSQDYESPELANFREEWRAELDSRKRARRASASLIVDEEQGKAPTSALSVYKQAIQSEQAGDLHQALTLYRQAFRRVSQFLSEFLSVLSMSTRTQMSTVHFVVKRCCSINNLGRRSHCQPTQFLPWLSQLPPRRT